jgi:chemotaxis protein methyltransferase CheR
MAEGESQRSSMRRRSAALVTHAKRYLRRFTDPVRYQLRVRFQPRQNHIYSQFYRFPHQYEVLLDHVLPDLLKQRQPTQDRPLEVTVFACCSGEEAYTLAYLLSTKFPEIPVRITGFDIVEKLVAEATAATYGREHVRSGPFVEDAFVGGLFDSIGDQYRVKPGFASLASFRIGDMTDPVFIRGLPRADLVFAQNVLFHLPRRIATRAFGNLTELVRPGGALFVNGMDTDMRVKLTKRFQLEPIVHAIEAIHEDARVDRGANWSSSYWGREPFSKRSRDWVRKYCTIYRKPT